MEYRLGISLDYWIFIHNIYSDKHKTYNNHKKHRIYLLQNYIIDLSVDSFVFSDLPYDPPRRSAWTSHGHPTPQSKGTVLALLLESALS